MSIKILLISSDEELFHKMESAFRNHIERGFFIIYSSKHIENNPNKIIYDLIITEEKYLSLIPVKNIPIIVLNSTGGNIDNDELNLIYVDNPIKLEDLYDIILSLQYRFNSSILINEPTIKEYINTGNKIPSNLSEMFEKNIYDDYNLSENFTNNETTNPEKILTAPEIILDVEPIIKNENIKNNMDNDLNKNNNMEINKENHQLITKFYNFDDLKKITKILNNYGSENKIDDKIIAQASIILDELLYTIQNLENFNDILKNKEPKILMTIKNYNHEFHMNIQCLIPIENEIHNIISIAQDYGNIIQSFKRNNSYFLNVNWYL